MILRESLISGLNLILVIRNQFDNISWLPQSCLLVPLLYLVHINDLYSAIKCCKLHHFADDTNLMNFQASVKTFNKKMNHDLKKLIKFD